MKICLSGPAASGKTSFINEIAHSQPTAVIYHEATRIISQIYPGLDETNLSKFRRIACDYQRNLEVLDLWPDFKERSKKMRRNPKDFLRVYDRGIIDNLAFLCLQKDKFCQSEISRIAKLYKDGDLDPYDYILYFDISPVEITDTLSAALSDPLRKSMINVDNYAEHVAEFRNAFIEVAAAVGMTDRVRTIATFPDEAGYINRNNKAMEFLSSNFNVN